MGLYQQIVSIEEHAKQLHFSIEIEYVLFFLEKLEVKKINELFFSSRAMT